jgi:hypothetical protein
MAFVLVPVNQLKEGARPIASWQLSVGLATWELNPMAMLQLPMVILHPAL